jgi:DNA (cytosine-5)-methyltransferase 1
MQSSGIAMSVKTGKPRLLDLFSGAGGCSAGYAQAGFEVVGVDIEPQPHYPFEFHQADAFTFPLDGFDVIHASPPCQAYSKLHAFQDKIYPALLPLVRKRLQEAGNLYVIENVIGAPIEQGVLLCGSMFSLRVLRHRWFESNIILFSPGPCQHKGTVAEGDYLTVAGHGDRSKNYTKANINQAMGIDWMGSIRELTQAIPPAYTRYVGQFLYDAVMHERQVAV